MSNFLKKSCLFCLDLDHVFYYKYGCRNKCCLVCAYSACRCLSVFIISLFFLVGFIVLLVLYFRNNSQIGQIDCILLSKNYTLFNTTTRCSNNQMNYILNYTVTYTPNDDIGNISHRICNWGKECYTCAKTEPNCTGTESYHSCNRLIVTDLNSYNNYQVQNSYTCYYPIDQPTDYIYFSNPVLGTPRTLSFICFVITICFWIYLFCHFICDYQQYRVFHERGRLLKSITTAKRNVNLEI